MATNILILGGGFGGLEVATSLRTQCDDSVNITLIDKKEFFIIGFTKFDLMFGRRAPEDIKHYYADLNDGIEFVKDEVEKLDPEYNSVVTSNGTYSYDYLVISLGVKMHRDAIPGFKEGGYSFYSFKQAQKLHPIIEDFDSGTILISIFENPYQCPPAPYEAALQLHDLYSKKGTRSNITIKMLAPSPIPLPIAPTASVSLIELLDSHDIEFLAKHRVTALDKENKQAIIEGQEPMNYDLFMGVPIHRPPAVILDSPFGKDGWIRPNPENLRTEFDNVYAIGDVTHIPAGDFAVPKTGAFAEDAAKTVVLDLLNRINNESNVVKYKAMGACFVEVGSGQVAKVQGNILGGTEPELNFLTASEEYRADKVEFETSRIKKWFKS